MAVKVDDVTLSLSALEFSLYPPGLIAFFFAQWTMWNDQRLSAEFRTILCLMLLRTPLSASRRMATLYLRVFEYGENEVPFQRENLQLTYFSWYWLCVCMFFLAVERLLCTYLLVPPSCPRRRSLSIQSPLALAILVVALLLTCYGLEGYCLYCMAGTILITGLILVWLYVVNRRRRRQSVYDDLSHKSQTVVNIISLEIFMPCMVNAIICMAATIAVVEFQSNILHTPLGHDAGKINNVYGLLIAYDSLSIPLLIVLSLVANRRWKERQLRRRLALDGDAEHAQRAYFTYIHSQWN